MATGLYELIKAASEEFLQESGSNSSSSAKSNKQILSAIRSQIESGALSISATDGTILSYLSRAANDDENTGIVSGGPRGGYWFDASAKSTPEAKPSDEEKITSDKGAAVTVREKDLYPLMELWLDKKGYKAKDISNLKSGGRWGNPDIIGVGRVELFGAVDVDLASCEIKLSQENWEQVIFEAISHKRFANRSWFCYRVKEDDAPLPKGIEYYAERYRVGVVQVVLSDQELSSLKNGQQKPIDFIDQVIERVPALYDNVPLKEKSELVDRTGITLTLTF